ncbi:MAG: UDP-3-O-(3-hydroxymyristoyl)glucosamine N-acyltransferase [Planctomycetota bacterium]
MPLTVAELAELVAGKLEGDGAARITGVAPLASAGPSDLAFFSDRRHGRALAACRAGVVLLPPSTAAPRGLAAIRVKDPKKAMILAIRALKLEDTEPPFRGVHALAFVDEGATLGEGVVASPFATVCRGARIGDACVLYPGAFVDRDAVLGRGCVLFPHACVMHRCRLGNDVVLGPGAVVGHRGFGFHPTAEGLMRVPQLGTVIVEDGVCLGANTTVDRAGFDATVVRRGAALDNLIHVAHNCSVGEHTAIAALTGVAGGTKIGARCMIAGHVGIAGHVEIGDGAVIGAKSGVAGSVPAGATVSGLYAREHGRALREYAAIGHLPELLRRVRELEKKLRE